MARLATKEARLAVQTASFESLINKGYNKEVYKDLTIFTMQDTVSTWLKVYRGTGAHEILFKRYTTKEQAENVINNMKASHDRNKAYKAELKANPIKSSSANCASAIREELKKEFTGVKFKVTSQNFSGGDSVHITWSDGPTTDEISNVTSKYQYGRFDSMTDMYEYSNSNEKLPQSKYVQTRREISEEVNNIVFESLKNFYSEDTKDYEIKQDCYRIINKTSIPVGATVTGAERTGQNGTIEDFYRLTMLLPETRQNQPKETPNFEAVEVPEGQIQIIDYSEKAIAVIGETKPIKDKLKELGGKFNFRLSCGAGWIFPKTKLQELEAFLSGGETEEQQEPKQEEETTLKDEISKTVNFLADLDVKIYGEVSESVQECARVQEVEIHTAPEQTQLSFFL